MEIILITLLFVVKLGRNWDWNHTTFGVLFRAFVVFINKVDRVLGENEVEKSLLLTEVAVQELFGFGSNPAPDWKARQLIPRELPVGGDPNRAGPSPLFLPKY
ncbi:Uncharacterized protein Fot_54360 [Forsythia ovata]|uniref:Uncharacterized protein n=1 Tax=Forsythia ovata TaxID=205694 RepID=A0ABD1PGT7_9LAMI